MIRCVLRLSKKNVVTNIAPRREESEEISVVFRIRGADSKHHDNSFLPSPIFGEGSGEVCSTEANRTELVGTDDPWVRLLLEQPQKPQLIWIIYSNFGCKGNWLL